MNLAEIGAANLAGIMVYLASAIAAIVTSMRMVKTDRRAGAIWLLVCAVFLGLALVRLAGTEEALRQWLRGYLLAQREYHTRQTVQKVALIASLGGIAVGLVWLLPRIVHRPLWQVLLAAAAALLVLFYSLRIISLHAVDRLLYASIGPLHFNHLLEMIPIAAAWYAAWLCMSGKARPARRRFR